MDPRLQHPDESLAATIKRHVRQGGPQAEVAASIAREFAGVRFGPASPSPCGMGRVAFYAAAGLDATGEIRK